MSDYTIAVDGDSSIVVFSRNGNSTLYRINLGSDTESISSTILNGNRLSVTRTTNTGNVVYAEYEVRDNQAIKLSNKERTIGNVQKRKKKVEERTESIYKEEVYGGEGEQTLSPTPCSTGHYTSMRQYRRVDEMIINGILLTYFSYELFKYHTLVYNQICSRVRIGYWHGL